MGEQHSISEGMGWMFERQGLLEIELIVLLKELAAVQRMNGPPLLLTRTELT